MNDWKQEFREKFGECTLSLCDEHEAMRCEKCKIEDFIEEVLRYKAIDYLNEGIEIGWKEAWDNIKSLLNPIYKNTRQRPRLRNKTQSK